MSIRLMSLEEAFKDLPDYKSFKQGKGVGYDEAIEELTKHIERLEAFAQESYRIGSMMGLRKGWDEGYKLGLKRGIARGRKEAEVVLLEALNKNK